MLSMSPEHTRPEAEQQTIPIVAFALSYAQNGWPVFPLAGKIPFKDSNGHRDATTDEAVIHAMWSQHPKANIGLPTGRVSGVIVLDMDVPEGYYNLRELQRRYDILPPTRMSRTANGGLHYFYQYPQNGNTYHGTVALDHLKDVDARAEGNYVVLPPSRLFHKYYRWNDPEQEIAKAPEWLLSLLPKAEEQRHVYPQGFGFASPSGEKWLAEALERASEGNRNAEGFRLACQLRDDGISQKKAQAILLAYANRVPQKESPYTAKEALASVRSAYRRSPRPPAMKR
jgi:hypothetical protein